MAEKQPNHIRLHSEYHRKHKRLVLLLCVASEISLPCYCLRRLAKMCFPVSLWPLLSNDEQCKVLDIKFHAFQIPTFFFFNPLYISLKTWQVEDCWAGIRKKEESAFKKCREVRKRRSKGFNSSNLECR